MDFAEGLSTVVLGMGIAVAGDPAHGFLADDLGALLGLGIDDDLIGTVNLVVGEHAVLEHEPSWPPSFAVIHPLVQYPRDSVPDQVVDLHVHHHRRRRLFPLLLAPPVAAAGDGVVAAMAVAVAVAVAGSRIGSDGGCGGRRKRRHGEVREVSRGRWFDWGGLVGDGGDAAERMHVGEMLFLRVSARANR